VLSKGPIAEQLRCRTCRGRRTCTSCTTHNVQPCNTCRQAPAGGRAARRWRGGVRSRGWPWRRRWRGLSRSQRACGEARDSERQGGGHGGERLRCLSTGGEGRWDGGRVQRTTHTGHQPLRRRVGGHRRAGRRLATRGLERAPPSREGRDGARIESAARPLRSARHGTRYHAKECEAANTDARQERRSRERRTRGCLLWCPVRCGRAWAVGGWGWSTASREVCLGLLGVEGRSGMRRLFCSGGAACRCV